MRPRLAILKGAMFLRLLPRTPARLRFLIKDDETREGLKVELGEAPGLGGDGVRGVTDAATGMRRRDFWGDGDRGV